MEQKWLLIIEGELKTQISDAVAHGDNSTDVRVLVPKFIEAL